MATGDLSCYFRVYLGLAPTTGTFVLNSSLIGGADVLDGELGYSWTDVTDYVVQSSVTFRRGAQGSPSPWWRYEAGSLSFTLDNADDRFSAVNTSGPYSIAGINQLRPGIPVRLQFYGIPVGGGTNTRELFQGWIDTYEPDYSHGFPTTVSITAFDAVERLQAADLDGVSPVGTGDLVGDRLNRILDNIGWPASLRDIDDDPTFAFSTLQPTSLAQPAWTEMLLSADADNGVLFITPTGEVKYQSRLRLDRLGYVFDGTDGTGLAYESAVVRYDTQQVINRVSLARVGGLQITVEDLTSQALNGIRSYSRFDLPCIDDSDVQELANWILFRFATLVYRVESITLMLLQGADNTDRWSQVGQIGIGDAVQLRHPTGGSTYLDLRGNVRGISWSSSPGVAVSVTLYLQPQAMLYDLFTLNSSLLDSTTQLLSYF